ncbi:peptidoglycan-binding protein LysM [candidate division WOR-3 bacterium]|nr:peptidoglycan-binding protein LysM [candidate division WOR-3 bacterium]
MALLDFVKDAGKNLIKDVKQATLKPEDLAEELKLHGIEIQDIKIGVDKERVLVSGKARSQEMREKAILCLGNIKGVSQIEDKIAIDKSEPESGYYTVKSGDTLSKISKEQYGDPNKYNTIFEANKPMLKDVNKIYPGQVLRIPKK